MESWEGAVPVTTYRRSCLPCRQSLLLLRLTAPQLPRYLIGPTEGYLPVFSWNVFPFPFDTRVTFNLACALGICAGIPVACRAGCLKDLRTTQERKGLEEEPEAAKVAADAQAAAHQAAPAQAAADGAASCEQAEQQAASRKRAAVPGDDASEEQPSLARVPFPVCPTRHYGYLLAIC